MDVRRISRRLRDLAEPIAANVYFAPEAQAAYADLGLDYPTGYFCSRGACLGDAPAEVVAAAFGVFNPVIVKRFVDAGREKADAATMLDVRERGAVAALRRHLGEPDTARVVEILRGVYGSQPLAGRALFAGLRALPFPEDPVAALWRVCDYVREHRGDAHIMAWVGAGCDGAEISLLTEIYWGIGVGTNAFTRGWTQQDIDEALGRLTDRGWIDGHAFTDEGRTVRRGIESATDALEAAVVRALGGDAEDVFAILEPWARTIVEQGGYPPSPMITGAPEDEPVSR